MKTIISFMTRSYCFVDKLSQELKPDQKNRRPSKPSFVASYSKSVFKTQSARQIKGPRRKTPKSRRLVLVLPNESMHSGRASAEVLIFLFTHFLFFFLRVVIKSLISYQLSAHIHTYQGACWAPPSLFRWMFPFFLPIYLLCIDVELNNKEE